MTFPVMLGKVSPRHFEFAGVDSNQADIITRISLGYKRFAAAALTGDVDIVTPAGCLLEDMWITFQQNFTGGTAATATIMAGTTGTPNAYIVATSVFSGAPAAIVAAATKGASLSSPQSNFSNQASPWATGTIRVRLTTTVGNTNVLTAGKLDLHVMWRGVDVRNTA